MGQWIVIRLHPAKPVAGADFTTYLQGLTITAYDLSCADTRIGAKVGTASYVAPPDATKPWLPDATSRIVQHFTVPPVPWLLPTEEAAATAIIEITALPGGYKEYSKADLRLELTRGTTKIPHKELYYDVATQPSPVPAASAFPTIAADDVAIYLGLPAPISGGLSVLGLGDDLTPPNYKALTDAVDAVLAADRQPVPPAALGNLTPEQARHIAYEILWAPQETLPLPPSSGSAVFDDLGALYTNPPNDGSLTNAAEQKRQQFEGDLTSHYATLNAKVDRLARYVYALSAAVACEKLSVDTTKVLFELPVNPNAASPQATLHIAQLLLINGTGSGPIVPAFAVPAQYFYVLGAHLPMQVTVKQRFQTATRDNQERLLPLLTAAVDDGTLDPVPAVNPAQAVRRLTALRPASDESAAICTADASVLPLINDWLAFPSAASWRTYEPGDDATKFWTPEATAQPLPYVRLVLCALTGNFKPLVDAVLAIPVSSVVALAALTSAEWTKLFLVKAATSANITAGSTLPFASASDISGVSVGMFVTGRGIALGTTVTAISTVAPISVSLSAAVIGDVPKGTTIKFTNPGLLPPFTAPGTFDSRLAAFIRHVEKFFALTLGPQTLPVPVPGGPGFFDLPVIDLIAEFVAAYQALIGGPFTFGGGALDDAKAKTAIQSIGAIAADAPAQAWLNERVHAINDLCALAGVVSAPTLPTTPSTAFSIVEALYARGFTSAADISALSLDDFTSALRGTVAYTHAAGLYAAAGGAGGTAPPAAGPFRPVNPGSLVDCVPPCWLSPLGPTEYLHELLSLSEASTCEQPFAPPPPGAMTLGDAVAARRGPIGTLAVTAANAETQIPKIDIVNENLEHLATLTSPPAGVIRDTATATIADHALCPPCEPASDACHPPSKLLAALPEHSTPAVPVADPTAYDKLRVDFSDPVLPYSQPLDVSRTYLDQFGTCRFAAMRVAREQITELALDPTLAAPTFQSHLWRYPVKLDIAIEYLAISPEEHQLLFTNDIVDAATPDHLVLHELYGFDTPTPGGIPWSDLVRLLPELLRRTGLSYCELVELQRSGCFKFEVVDLDVRRSATHPPGHEGQGMLPDCEPCCPEHLLIRFIDPADTKLALKQLAIFVRLWRKLQHVCGARYSFVELCDICHVLGLFDGTSVNPDFIRQLAAFQMLRDDLRLRLTDGSKPAPGASGADRCHLLALWSGPASSKWSWAVSHLIDRIQHYAKRRHAGHDRSAHFIKLLSRNLDPLSILAGFDPARPSDTWHARPTNTLRFAELLAKIHASSFGIGELLYLFAASDHVDGDDPFPLQDPNECLDDPLNLPEDETFSLWALRQKLLDVEVTDEEAHAWTWHRIERALRHDFGYSVPPGGTDYLLSLGQHYFPSVLEHAGISVSALDRQYRVALAVTSEDMWNVPPGGPFHYDAAAKQLWTQLPLRDQAVVEKLQHIRALTAAERHAVQDLYALPRVDLAPFASLFPDFAAAETHLIEADERERWLWFRRHFALAHKRCTVIADHLARHVSMITEREYDGSSAEAWLILKSLFADENRALTTWEADSGLTPDVTWKPRPSGSAFSALLGLAGTGLLGTIRRDGGALAWVETRGPLAAFGDVRNAHSSPAPTLVPALDLSLTAEQLRFVELRNGFAIAAHHGRPLGGAEGFSVTWSGVLLVEQEGRYEFKGVEAPHEHTRWRVTLGRGQKTWLISDHHWRGPSERVDGFLTLKRGAYAITVELKEPAPPFRELDDVREQRTGFELRYAGPDTAGELQTIPVSRLYRDAQEETLRAGVELPDNSAAGMLLELRYTSTLRDIRRTYQRAFKALLFAYRFELSAKDVAPYRKSELGYMLEHPDLFAGVAYYRNPVAFSRHAAGFDFNFLPVLDPYRSPGYDERSHPATKRTQALFDWWERLFDYAGMRRDRQRALERPVWLLFEEASETQPDNPTQLLRHLDVDLRVASVVLAYFTSQTTPVKTLASSDLEDDRWAVRVWHASSWCHDLVHHFATRDMRVARPDLWASDDPSGLVPGETETGSANLSRFLVDGCIESGAPRRYEDVQRLANGLRERARNALIAFLCAMNRVPLPWGGTAATRKDLSALLLLDVEAGILETASRIEEAITAVQIFVQRARLGLEPAWPVSGAFVKLWTQQFELYRTWEACKCRTLYRENHVEWDELRAARRIEAFQFLEAELRRSTLTIAVPGGFEYWPDSLPPVHPNVSLLQQRDASSVRLLAPGREGLGILGTPERDARPSWLAPDPLAAALGPNDDHRLAATNANATASAELPLWMQAAIRLGATFIRVAAAGVPPAAAMFQPREHSANPCCDECGCRHEPHADEFYFWLVNGEAFSAQDQDEYYDATLQSSTRWHDEDSLPTLLDWTSARTARLAWCRIHNGVVQQVRRSDEQVTLLPDVLPDLVFVGRVGDSLTFSVTGATMPVGYLGAENPGFRYDLPNDLAVPLPTLTPAPAVPNPYPGGLPAYPFFAFVEPGERLFPSSMFSAATAVAGVLRCHQRFEPALKWYQLALDPLSTDNVWIDCRPRRDDNDNTESRDPTGVRIHVPPRNGDVLPVDMCCDATDVSDIVVRRRAILLHYIETLLAWSHALRRRSSRESSQLARLVLDTAATILGPCPKIVVNHSIAPSQTVATFVPANAPLNPRLMQLYRDVKDGLDLIHRNESEARLRNATNQCLAPYWGQDPCDCGPTGHHGCCPSTSERCCGDHEPCCGPSPYRFTYLVQKALDAAARVRGLGSALLSAFEKGDAEFLASLRAGHDAEIAEMSIQLRKDQWRDADWQVRALQRAKEVAQSNRRYYKRLIDLGLNPGELNYQSNTTTSIGLRSAAIPVEAVGEALRLIPDLFVGFPCEETWLPLGTKLGEMFQTIARITNELAEISSVNASLDLTQAGWQRRFEEWAHQVEIFDIQIEEIEVQILGAERRRDIALRSLNIQQRQLEQSREVRDFLRDKFTNHELYLFLQRETAAIYSQMYDVARELALEAQTAFNFELARGKRTFVPCDDWDSLHEGLLAGERLELALQRADAEYTSCNRREYELTKHISLATSFPRQLLQLKLTGACEIEVPEWMFDQDYPGHYMRRIRNVSLTIPCVTGPYTGVHCRLTLLRSATRIDPTLPCPESECCDRKPVHPCGCRHELGEHYQPCACDRRLVRQYGASEALATSTGRNDAGLFELNFRDERRLPFEFQGAVSCWRIELPPDNNYFDLDSLTDVVLQMNYTAREGGDALREAASAAARAKLPGDGWIYLDLERDFPDAWEMLRRSRSREAGRLTLQLPLSRKLFPFLPGDPKLTVCRIALLLEADDRERPCPELDGCPCPHDDIDAKTIVRVAVDRVRQRGDDDCEVEVACVQSADWPGLYHGVSDIETGTIQRRRDVRTLTLGFQRELRELRRGFVMLRYVTVGDCCDDVRLTTRRHHAP